MPSHPDRVRRNYDTMHTPTVGDTRMDADGVMWMFDGVEWLRGRTAHFPWSVADCVIGTASVRNAGQE